MSGKGRALGGGTWLLYSKGGGHGKVALAAWKCCFAERSGSCSRSFPPAFVEKRSDLL